MFHVLVQRQAKFRESAILLLVVFHGIGSLYLDTPPVSSNMARTLLSHFRLYY